MADIRNQHVETGSLMNGIAFGVNLEVPYMDYEPSAGTCNASRELSAKQTKADDKSVALNQGCMIQNCDNNVSVQPRSGYLTDDIEEFIVAVRRHEKNIYGKELLADIEESFRQILPLWNTFLQPVPAVQWTEVNKKWIEGWLPRWNMFLLARAGKPLVTYLNFCLTIMEFILYILDLLSDIGTFLYYVSNGQWWQAIVTLVLVYGAVIICTVVKWKDGQIHCTGSVDWIRYVGSLLFNWPDVMQYRALCLIEWKLHKSPENSACIVPEWQARRVNVAYLKFMEGLCEACPQAILQMHLLIPDLYGDWTWTDYFRIAAASISLCTAGAALLNMEKFRRIINYIDLPPSELVVLYVWAVPVTVSRLLSMALLSSVHPYWALAGVVLHLVLRGVLWCRTWESPRTLYDVINMCLYTILFCISPFDVVGSSTYRRVYHTIHFLGNFAATVVWAFDTPLKSTHPALYTAIICFNAVMFAVGLLGWQLHCYCSTTGADFYPKHNG